MNNIDDEHGSMKKPFTPRRQEGVAVGSAVRPCTGTLASVRLGLHNFPDLRSHALEFPAAWAGSLDLEMEDVNVELLSTMACFL
jgi:hypothetical protein